MQNPSVAGESERLSYGVSRAIVVDDCDAGVVATPLTVLYDEDCGFCTAAAGWLAKRDGIVAAPIGGEKGDAALHDMSRDERYASFHVVDSAGRVSSSGEALTVLLGVLPAGRVTSRLARRFPRVTEAVYRQTAKRRDLLGRLFRVDACRVDRAETP
jgi:predicted DCC family thiol-disulfide oxidoreductase YuxK